MIRSSSQRRTWRRALLVISAALVIAAAITTACVWQPWKSAVKAATSERTTVAIQRTSLTASTVLNAQLGYGQPRDLVGTGGLVTALPSPGRVIRRGEPVYEADGRPVILMKGKRPLWRDIGADTTDGPDVEQLERNLVAEGHGLGIAPDEKVTRWTVAAIKSWQKAHSLPTTGTIGPADVVMVPAGAIRVADVAATLGTAAERTVLTWTGTTLQASANLTDDQAGQLQPDTDVSVTLPDGTRTKASITAVQTDTGTDDDGADLPPRAVIDFSRPADLKNLGPVAVRATVVTGTADDVLVVPVTALLALAEGGYGVQVVTGDDGRGAARLVAVEIGLVADARAAVTGGDLAEGDRVVVAG